MGLKNNMSVLATIVSNEFIDQYMAAANGEYVKVFLYLLRHAGEPVEVSGIADALNHTEADVKRALAYWEKLGLLSEEKEEAPEAGKAAGETVATAQPALELPEQGDSYERMERLSEDEEFSALLYAVQQYLGKTFTQIECEKFAFFYDGLHLSGDLLEYLAEYCAEGGHTNIRYIERVAINWYREGIRTREEARNYTVKYSKDTSAVMRAFGITNRSPATAEQEYIKKWFREYGFDSKLVVEACSRTIKATGAASFPYADKILSGWKEAGVKVLGDVEELDKKRQKKRNEEKAKEPQKKGGTANRFKNFDERSYNYEDYVWEDMRSRQRKGGGQNGTQ